MYQSQVHDVEELLDIWHDFQLSAVDSTVDGESILSPACVPKEEFSSDTIC